MTFRTCEECGSIDVLRQRNPDEKATRRPADLTLRGKMPGEGVQQRVPTLHVRAAQVAHRGVEVSQRAELGSHHCAKMIDTSAAVAKAALDQTSDQRSATRDPADTNSGSERFGKRSDTRHL